MFICNTLSNIKAENSDSIICLVTLVFSNYYGIFDQELVFKSTPRIVYGFTLYIIFLISFTA